MKAYHGTPNPEGFTEFDPELINSRTTNYVGEGPGFYLTLDPEEARNYTYDVETRKPTGCILAYEVSTFDFLYHRNESLELDHITQLIAMTDPSILENWNTDIDLAIRAIYDYTIKEENAIEQCIRIWRECYEHRRAEFIKNVVSVTGRSGFFVKDKPHIVIWDSKALTYIGKVRRFMKLETRDRIEAPGKVKDILRRRARYEVEQNEAAMRTMDDQLDALGFTWDMLTDYFLLYLEYLYEERTPK